MRLAMCLWLAGTSVPAAIARPADTLPALGHALTSCFTAPEASTGDQVTVRLSLTREGAVLGTPRVTFSHLVERDGDRRAFVAAVLTALARCTPVELTPGLGAAVAGRPFSIRFMGGPPPRGT